MDSFGSRLLVERRRLKKAQKHFCEATGVGPVAQSNYENDKRVPDADYLMKLERIGVDLLYLLTGKRQDPQLSTEELLLDVERGESRYSIIAETVPVCLAAQERVGITLSAPQLQALMDFAMASQLDEDGLVAFIKTALQFADTGNT